MTSRPSRASDAGFFHAPGSAQTRWTRVNVAEALPGAPTPLSWSMWSERGEVGVRAAWRDLGVLRRSEVGRPSDVDRQLMSIFHGRPAVNVEMLRALADRTPGTSAEALETQLFGGEEVMPGRATRRRYPVVALRGPITLARLPAKIRRHHRETYAWWGRTISDLAGGVAGPPKTFGIAAARFEQSMRLHILATLFSQACRDAVEKLVGTAGMEGRASELSGGYGDLEDTSVMAELWEVSRGRASLDGFLLHHGYHGPNEGELSARSWREDPRPIESLLKQYRSMEQSPRTLEQNRQTVRVAMEQDLLSRLSRARRPQARIVLRLARRFTILREQTKASFVRTLDVARAAARERGRSLVEERLLAEADDVFFLTTEELVEHPTRDHRERVAERKGEREQALLFELPTVWTGLPQEVRPTEVASSSDDELTLTGLGVSPGSARGRVRVIVDPSETSDFEAGDVLVCPFTDPSWGSILFVAGALVVDIGGPMSHAAIIAREIGVPCVIARDGTRRLRSGDAVRVDGDEGVVEILMRSS